MFKILNTTANQSSLNINTYRDHLRWALDMDKKYKNSQTSYTEKHIKNPFVVAAEVVVSYWTDKSITILIKI